MPAYKFQLNGKPATVDSWDPGQPLLYLLRNSLSLRAPKFGCGLGQCGACTILVDGRAQRSCLLPVRQASGKSITTLEGLNNDPVQTAFIAESAAQCGYCTNGMIMQAKSLLGQNPRATREQIQQGMAGNLCRCGTHTRILRAIERAVSERAGRVA